LWHVTTFPTRRSSDLARESAAAAKVLGVERTLLGLKNREVVHDIQSRHKLAAVVRIHRPDWMFVPYPIDAHPDHVAVTKIAEDRSEEHTSELQSRFDI